MERGCQEFLAQSALRKERKAEDEGPPCTAPRCVYIAVQGPPPGGSGEFHCRERKWPLSDLTWVAFPEYLTGAKTIHSLIPFCASISKLARSNFLALWVEQRSELGVSPAGQ